MMRVWRLIGYALVVAILVCVIGSNSHAQSFSVSARGSEFQPHVDWSGRVNAIARHPKRPFDIVVATPTGGLFASRDGGYSWAHVETLPPVFVSDVKVHPLAPDLLIATATKDFAVSIVSPIPEQPNVQSTAPPGPGGVVEIPGEGGVVALPGGGGTVVQPGGGGIVTLPIESSTGGIWISRDTGRTWSRPDSAVPLAVKKFSSRARCRGDYSAYGIGIDPAAGTIYVATDCGVSISDDFGSSWRHAEIANHANGDRMVSVTPLGNGRVMASGYSGHFWSLNFGKTWQKDPNAPGICSHIHAIGDSPRDNEAFVVSDAEAMDLVKEQGVTKQIRRKRSRLFQVTIPANGDVSKTTWRRIESAPVDGADNCGGIAFARAHRGEPGRNNRSSDDLYFYYGNQCDAYAEVVRRNSQTGRLIFPSAPADWTRISSAHTDARHLSLKLKYREPPGGSIVRDGRGRVVRSTTWGGMPTIADGGAMADGGRFSPADAVEWQANDGGLERRIAIPVRASGAITPGGTRLGGVYVKPIGPQPVGSGVSGINGLQITEINGQAVRNSGDHMYFATQDTDLWASLDAGQSWPFRRKWEGFGIDLERQVATEADARITFTACGRCSTRVSGYMFSNDGDWPDPLKNSGWPVLVRPGVYIQQETRNSPINPAPNQIRGGVRYIDISYDLGRNWGRIAYFPEEFRSVPQIWNGTQNNTMLYQAVRVGSQQRTFYDRQSWVQHVLLARVHDILGRSQGTVRYPAMNNFGSLGVMPTMFAWYWVYAVDHWNGMHLIAPDVYNGRMAESFDGGRNWSPMTDLTNLVTQNGAYRFVLRDHRRRLYFPLISAISFHPGNPNLVLVGARQGGVYVSADRGKTWSSVPGTEKMVNITRLHWRRLNEAIVSTYGRGLWKINFSINVHDELSLTAQSRWLESCRPAECEYVSLTDAGQRVPLAEWLAAANDSIDRLTLVFDGELVSANAQGLGLRSIAISPGASLIAFGNDSDTAPQLAGPNRGEAFVGLPGYDPSAEPRQIVGFIERRGVLDGLVFAAGDLAMPGPDAEPVEDDSPTSSPIEGRPYSWVQTPQYFGGTPVATTETEITVVGQGFEPNAPLDIEIDGSPYLLADVLTEANGEFGFVLPANRLPKGRHRVVVRQGDVADVTDFQIVHIDDE